MQPLSTYLGQPAPPAAPSVDFPQIDKDLVKTNFFEYLDFALRFAPPGDDEKDIRAKLAKIGVGAGKSFDFHELPLGHRLEIGLGMKQGDKKVDEYLATAPKDINGWRIGSWFGDRAFFTAIGCCVLPARRAASTATMHFEESALSSGECLSRSQTAQLFTSKPLQFSRSGTCLRSWVWRSPAREAAWGFSGSFWGGTSDGRDGRPSPLIT